MQSTDDNSFSTRNDSASSVYVHAAAGLGVSVAELRNWKPEELRRRALEALRVIEGHREVLERQQDALQSLLVAARSGGWR